MTFNVESVQAIMALHQQMRIPLDRETFNHTIVSYLRGRGDLSPHARIELLAHLARELEEERLHHQVYVLVLEKITHPACWVVPVGQVQL
jgi:hypothetical protein